jgi:hypothetical protein
MAAAPSKAVSTRSDAAVQEAAASITINQPCRKQRGMVVPNKELQPGFNTFLTAPRGARITEANSLFIILPMVYRIPL